MSNASPSRRAPSAAIKKTQTVSLKPPTVAADKTKYNVKSTVLKTQAASPKMPGSMGMVKSFGYKK